MGNVWPATYGATVIVVPRETTRDPGLLLELLKREKVTVLNQTPSSFYNLLAIALEHSRMRSRASVCHFWRRSIAARLSQEMEPHLIRK